ncbi:MAG: phosphoribosylanthranilate isomerase [Clostridiales Family XIII bacterium]|jgi:phosphoribosylanthranilate isomerase|nr:phosphoribosylanthranilate isomerase [Clostridiales Family XIII bacterium]
MTLIKICGLKRPEDIEYANACLPDFIGFVFAESRRKIRYDEAAVLKQKLDMRIKAVGVFVNEEISRIETLCRSGTIDWIQLHGDEDDKYIRRLKTILPNPIVKAVSVGSAAPQGTTATQETTAAQGTTATQKTTAAQGTTATQETTAARGTTATQKTTAAQGAPVAARGTTSADYLLFDTYSGAARGGSGNTFDWRLICGVEKPYFLAGGLDASNLAEAITLLHPYCVDLSSGVETNGLKDYEKMMSAVDIVRRIQQ